MLITYPKYYFRYTTKSNVFGSSHWYKAYPDINKPILLGFIASAEARDLLARGCTIIEWAPYTTNNQTRVKPQNVLFVDRPHTQSDIHRLMCDLSWQLDLRTVNLDAYPEYFI